MNRTILLLFFTFGLSTVIEAQDIDTSLLVEDIVIYQNRLSLPINQTARNITVINKTQIEELPVFSLPELLQYTGGVDIRRRGVNGVQSDAGIRGGSFNHVQILINGVKMNDPQTGHHMMNLPVSITDVERIEIIKGPAARIFGQNAFSGVINIITKLDSNNEIGVDVGLNYSSFETFQNDIQLRIPSKSYNQSFSFSHIGSKGYRYNTDYNINTMFYQSELKGIGTGLKINAGYTDRKFGANGFYANEAYTDQYEEVTTKYISATTTFVKDHLTIRPRVSWRNNFDSYVFLRDNPSFFMNEHTGNTYNAELHMSYISDLGVTGFGIDASKETLVSNNLGDRERSILGLFLEHRISLLNNKLGITPGFYANKITERDLKIYPGLDVSYELSQYLHLFGSANWADRIPTYTNLYYSSPVEQGNPDLLSESATSFEIGAKYNSPTINITASLWKRDTKDLIDWAKDSLSQEKWFVQNFNQVNFTGVDLNSSFKMSDLLGNDRDLTLSADYTYISGSVADDINVALSRYALDNLNHQLILGATFTVLPKVLFLNTNFRYIDRELPNDSGDPAAHPLKNYQLLDTKLSYKKSSFDAFFSINNLTDQQYRETTLVPMPGRSYTVGVKIKNLN